MNIKKRGSRLKLSTELEVNKIKYNYVVIIRPTGLITVSRSTYIVRTVESKDNKIVFIDRTDRESRYFYIDCDFNRMPAWLETSTIEIDNVGNQFSSKYSNIDFEV